MHADHLRSAIIENVIRMLSCGLTIIGYTKYCCANPNCSHEKKVCFSCKSRFCSSCGKKATDQWILTQQETLPDTEWQHITFTMPDALWPIFAHNRRLLKHPSRLAADVIKKIADEKNLLPGIFTALHTFGRDLKWNVHIHLSVTCGGLNNDATQWKHLYFPKAQIVPMWRYEIINLLRESYESLTLPTSLKAKCPTKELFDQWLDVHYRKTWIVHLTKPSASHQRNINYLGRYIKRPPLSLSRLKHYDGKNVLFQYLDHKTGKHKIAQYDTQEFIGRLVRHIPDKHFRLINYYGFLANRVRGKLLPKVYELLQQTIKTIAPIRWQNLYKQTFGTDPLICILCGAPLRLTAMAFGKNIDQLSQYHQALATEKNY